MKKSIIGTYCIIGVILEVMAYLLVGRTEAKLTYIMMCVAIPISLAFIFYIYRSYERVLLGTYLMVPLMPMLGYVILRMGLLNYQWVYYVGVYLLITVLLFKNGLKNKFSFKNIKCKEKPIKILLLILLIISCIMAFDKRLSFMIILLSFIPFILLNLVVMGSEIENKNLFYEKILIAITVGALVSMIPDFIYYVGCLVMGTKSKIFGPIGSNSSLSYILILFPITLSKWGNEKRLKNKWSLLVICFSISLAFQESRGALIAVICIFVMYMIFDFKNILRYLCVAIIVVGCMLYNVNDRADVSADDSLNILENVVVGNEKLSDTNNSLEEVIYNIIDRQSQSRQLLWKSAVKMTEDYPLTGVGIGNYRYFFKEYSGSDRDYAEAHSILLSMSSEIGLPFMILCFIYILWMMFSALYHYFKSKDWNLKRKYVSIGVLLTAFLVFGNITGISLQVTHEIYSFTVTFVILFIFMFRDNLETF